MKSIDTRDLPGSSLPGGWSDLTQRSTSEEELVQVMRDYVATWSPEELARLPIECRPGRIRDGEDIAQWAFELASSHCANTCKAEDEPILAKMLVFVTQASMRLAQLKATAPGPEMA